mgnify:CR=1 FL=1
MPGASRRREEKQDSRQMEVEAMFAELQSPLIRARAGSRGGRFIPVNMVSGVDLNTVSNVDRCPRGINSACHNIPYCDGDECIFEDMDPNQGS